MNNVELIGAADLDKFLKDIKIQNKKQLGQLLAKMAFSTHAEAVKSIQMGGRSGRVYRRKSVTHQASAPGEPPKTDTGQLVRNVTIENQGGMEYTVGSRKGAPHGFWLEFGTRFIRPRPWLKPAFDKTIKKFRAMFNG